MTASAQADTPVDPPTDVRTVAGPRVRRIGGDDVGRCLTRLHHDRFTDAVAVHDPVRERAFRLGIAHEELVTGIMVASMPGAIDLRDLVGDHTRTTATIAALDAGAPLIAGAALESGDGTMIGIADLVIRMPSGYAPVEVKHHKVVGDTGIEAMAAPLDDPTRPTVPVRFRSHRRRDLLQVAHYWRLLDELGHATTSGMAAVIGSDDPASCVWVDLTSGEPCVLDQHRDWITSARDAIAHGAIRPDDPLIAPWLRGECRTCPWRTLCESHLEDANDPTLLRGVDADLRATLAGEGVTTVAQVAALDPSDDRLPGPDAVLQARAMTAGRLLRLDEADDALDLPRRPIEVDFDIETHGGDIYLAGLLITEGPSSRYEPIADWTGTPAGEAALVALLFDRLAAWTSDDAIVYHWTDYEVRMLTAAAGRHHLEFPGSESVEAWFAAHACDLCAWSRRHLASPNGHSLKVIAPLCGFSWRDQDPGGLQSEIWFESLQGGDTSMRERLLAYNEDDVAAQKAVREWVSRQDSGRGPGSGIPSARIWPSAPLA